MSDEHPTEPTAEVEQPNDLTDPTTTESNERGRPSLPIIISGVLVLILIGVGLAFLLPSGSPPAAETSAPTAAPTTVGDVGDVTEAPPELPAVSEAIGDPTSTEVIVQVGDATIVRGDFVRYYQPGSDPTETLDQLIQIELVVQAAAEEGVVANEEAVDARIEEIKQGQAGGDEAMFQELLSQAQIADEAALRQLLLRDEVVQQMIMRHTTVEQARARHILISTEPEADEAAIAQAKAEAEDLFRQLEEGADFAALATEHSDDPGSAQEGGDLGWALRGLFVEPFDAAVFSMQVGEVRLVQSDFGWHIIELLDAPQVRPIDNPGLLETVAGQEAFGATFLPWIEQLQADAEAASRINILIPAAQLVTTP